MITAKAKDHYIAKSPIGPFYHAHPIYDWKVEDVWVAPQKFGWDYNVSYDLFERVGISRPAQRISPPYGEMALRIINLWERVYPEYAHRVMARVPGASAAKRWGQTQVYGIGKVEPPEGLTYREYISLIIEDQYSPEQQRMIKKTMNKIVTTHRRKSRLGISDTDPDPITGISWKFMLKVAIRGDFKGRMIGNVVNEAIVARGKLGITLDEAVDRWGTEEMKLKQAAK